MNTFDGIIIGQNSIPSLIITVILMIAIPISFFIYWRKNHKQQTRISWLIAGAVGFLVSARVMELGVHYFCIVSDNTVSRFINGNTAAYVLYGITMAGVFEECGRHIILKYIMKKNRTPENAVLYGIGHGGIEILAVVLPLIIMYLTIAVLFSSGNKENALSILKITEGSADTALPTVLSAASFNYLMMAMHVIERLLAMLNHIGLTIIVYYGILKTKSSYLLIAILLHMIGDIFPGLYQRSVVALWSVEVWGALWTSVTVSIAVILYRKMKGHTV